MIERELEDRQQELEALGEVLVKRYERLSSAQTQTNCQSVINFGRYLQASRRNAGLSPSELAQKAYLSVAIVLALEQGLFLTKEIQVKWLNNLAQALDEDVEDFRLMLGCQIGQRQSILKVTLSWLAPSNYQPQFKSKDWQWGRIYALSSAVIICFSLAIIMNYLFFFPSSSNSTEEMESFINVSTEQRLNMINAEAQFEYQIINLRTNSTTSRVPCCVY